MGNVDGWYLGTIDMGHVEADRIIYSRKRLKKDSKRNDEKPLRNLSKKFDVNKINSFEDMKELIVGYAGNGQKFIGKYSVNKSRTGNFLINYYFGGRNIFNYWENSAKTASKASENSRMKLNEVLSPYEAKFDGRVFTVNPLEKSLLEN